MLMIFEIYSASHVDRMTYHFLLSMKVLTKSSIMVLTKYKIIRLVSIFIA